MNYFIYKDMTVSPVQTLFYKNNIKNILIVIIDIAATKALWVVARIQLYGFLLTIFNIFEDIHVQAFQELLITCVKNNFTFNYVCHYHAAWRL